LSALSQERLRELFDYNPETGDFIRRSGRSGVKAGAKVGYLHPFGYWYIRVDGKKYRAHRLAWLYITGAWPSGDIDHRNGIRSDNRFCNLREATREENAWNSKPKRRDGLRGSYLPKRYKRWAAQIMKNGKSHRLGLFSTEMEAHKAYVAAATQLFGEFARAA
jgi:hypothetical protein